MAKSHAQKMRQKLVREGKRNPELSRSPFAFADMRMRKTKSKQEQMNSSKYKNRISSYGDDGSFLFSPECSGPWFLAMVKKTS
ncbi:hypothetical protein QYF50_22415 [Paenibacillus vini]|uniref:hypothetical protein n=1 Tax=Paenibacillus vini TaxID=1476024 RepID=UPI0025B72CF9|nr:hypothetical protein [Paenibacillus vini]MDN4070662.1 hypothetical protein [Paenibacillus vini]